MALDLVAEDDYVARAHTGQDHLRNWLRSDFQLVGLFVHIEVYYDIVDGMGGVWLIGICIRRAAQ